MIEPQKEVMQVPEAFRKEVAKHLEQFPNLRYYQREAIECAAFRMLKTLDPLLIVLPTGSGKSWVIAGLAVLCERMIKSRSGQGKKILVLAPSAELVSQNHAKFLEAGFKASIYMADLQTKDLTENMVLASPISFGNSIASIIANAHVFGAVVIDEAHEFTPMIRMIIEHLKTVNPNLRVIGLTATPYRMNTGYIYQQHSYYKALPLTARHTINPPFAEAVYEKTADAMIEEGFLSPPIIGNIEAHYDTQALRRTASGDKFTEESNNSVFVDGKQGKTKQIIADVIKQSQGRKGTLIFAQNRRHAREILALLPQDISALIDSTTDKRKERPRIIADFKAQKLKYLVSVGTLIKGFDAPHTEVAAILCHTESDARLQQIIGRVLRISPETGKKNALVLDYGENLPKDGNIFNSRINLTRPAPKGGEKTPPVPVDVLCPTCNNVSEFFKAKIPSDAHINEFGYLVSVTTGEIISTNKGEPIAGHMGTHCFHFHYPDPEGLPVRCTQTWGTVTCKKCHSLNSHRGHECTECGEILSEGDDKLSLIPSRPEGPYSPRLAKVIGNIQTIPGTSRSGNPTLRIVLQVQELPYFTLQRFAAESDEEAGISMGELLPDDDRTTDYTEVETLIEPKPEQIQIWLNPTVKHPKAQKAWAAFMSYVSEFTDEAITFEEHQVPQFLQRFTANDPQRFPIATPGYITYCQQKTADSVERVFHEILNYHQTHPYAPEKAIAGSPLTEVAGTPEVVEEATA